MAFKLIIEPEAQDEIEEAIIWYKSKQPGLEEDFYNYLDGYFETLKAGKALFSIKRKNFRELPLKRFPYIIIYEKYKKEIIVYSVFNTHQHSDKKRK